jgi:hypothetical protein
MRTNNLFAKVIALAAIVLTGVSFSCQEEEVAISPETANVIEESSTDFYYEDADDMAGVAVSSDSRTSTGRLSSEAAILVDDRLQCAEITLSINIDLSTELHPVGNITIDFGDGCTDLRGNIRKGIIKIAFDGKRFIEGSTVVVTFESYSINGIKNSGKRTLTNLTGSLEGAPKFQVELENGTIVWPNGTDATREHCYVRQWNRGNIDLLSDDELTFNQCDGHSYTAIGSNRRGINYKMIIVNPLVYKRCSPIAVSGTKKFINTDSGQEITIDYGSGVCDTEITITVNGVSRTFDAKSR